MKIKTAVIAAAGFGTRFLPATKTQPKEMLPEDHFDGYPELENVGNSKNICAI